MVYARINVESSEYFPDDRDPNMKCERVDADEDDEDAPSTLTAKLELDEEPVRDGGREFVIDDRDDGRSGDTSRFRREDRRNTDALLSVV
jgi:hypothetical protein